MSSGIINQTSQNILLKKKSSRKNRLAARYNKDLNLDGIKESFLDELFFKSWKKNNDLSLQEEGKYGEYNKENIINFQEDFKKTLDSLNKIDNAKINKNTEYGKKYKIFIQEDLSFSHFNLINRLINDSDNLPEKVKLNFPLHKVLYKIIKNLMMSELEIIYFSLFLDEFGWENQEIDETYNKCIDENLKINTPKIELEENLLFIAIFVKNYVNETIDYIIEYLKYEYKDFIIKLNYWSSIKLSEKNVFQIKHTKLNAKHKLLNRSYNTFCKANYIDYNCLVDQIIQMSQAYVNNEKTADNEIHTKNKSDFDLENLIKNRNLKNVNIFKTDTQVVKSNENRWQMNPNTKNQGSNNLINKTFIDKFNLNNQVKMQEKLVNKVDNKEMLLENDSKDKSGNKECLIKNPFEDHQKYMTEVDLNSITLNNPFEDISLKKTGNNETTISDLSNKKEVKKDDGNILEQIIQANNVDNKINENLIIIKENKSATFGRSDSLINNIHSAYPLNSLEGAYNNDEITISNRLVNSSSNINVTISEPFVSKNSCELTPSKITISSLHLKESSFKFGMNFPFGLDKEKGKFNEEEYTIPDDYCFRNYSSFFHQNSYVLPKKESELTPLSRGDNEKNILNLNYKFRRSSSININRKDSFLSNLQFKNEISIEFGPKLNYKEPQSSSNFKPSVSFYMKTSDES